ncbi:alpha/beta fold hydrolase [Falsiroseomonas selenitidurans]|uniref:Alpha/beta hydrolase n=1 Tax=Falsiroseomonas selenitidurans TaxID=2716335 RepID=A0ABX1DZL1_9PROT|nr:alpha/beta fold hydrolase [Falsiroseomonas selenitidurans]NKC29938.1 alpha/beta hydrolase [Falsiroseomonas selenitidurans]
MSVVLLPGFMLDAGLWDEMAPLLAPLGPIHHGDLFQDETMQAMAARVLADVPGRFVLVGFSMGGFVAREVARMAPARVRALVLVATSARGDSAAQQARRQAIAGRPAGQAFRGMSRGAIARGLHPDRAGDTALVDRLRAIGDRLGGAVFLRQSQLARPAFDTRLGEIACPTLVVAAAQDALRSVAEAEELAAGIPGARLHVIEGSGHMLPIEAPQALADLILDWVAAAGA